MQVVPTLCLFSCGLACGGLRGVVTRREIPARLTWGLLRVVVLGCLITQLPTAFSHPPVEEHIIEQYKKAVAQIEQGDFRGALSGLQAIVAQAPNFYQGLNSIGVCYEGLGQRENAIQAFQEALKINPGFVEAHINLGANYTARGKIPEGIAEFKRAIELNPRSVPALSGLGHAELQGKNPAAAVGPLKKAYDLSNHEPSNLPGLVRALTQAGQLTEAVRYSEAALHLKGWNPRLDMQLGLIFLDCRKCKEAQKSLIAAVRGETALRDQIVALSEDNFDAGKYTEVLCLVGVALESGPNSASLHSMAGACHYQLKDGPRAVAEVQQAIYLDPGNEDYYLQLAQVFIDYNTADAAILLLEPALERFPASARMRYVLGVACLRSSKYVEAERYLTESLRLDPKNPLALRALAMLYEGESQWAALLKLSESMLDLPDIRAEGYYYQANADFNLLRGQPDRFPEIEKLLESSTSLNPNFFPVYLFGAESSSRGVLTLRPSKSSPGPLSSTPSHPPPTTTWRLLTGRSAKPRKALKPSTGSKCLVRRRRISPRSRDSYTN